jgi:hypothetical protein
VNTSDFLLPGNGINRLKRREVVAATTSHAKDFVLLREIRDSLNR